MNPKELMISRYEAFVREDWEYIEKTSISQTLQELEQGSTVEWLKLNVIDAYENIVEFKAYYRDNTQVYVLHEKSSFVLVEGIWKYDKGELYNAKIERNEPCPCGSGKKYKRCCA